ncbi:MAG: chemotaxis protein CheW [Deltaproteobacteria bacterium]|nr:chemotaxis protein CheW [Deltaproteobacteria bacterium]
MQILLADNNPDFLQAVARFLRTDARIRQLHLARSGAEAIELADRENPNLVLLDWSLPDLKGLWAALRIMGGAAIAEVWMLAPNDNPEYERAARAAGAAGCLSRRQFTEKIEPILQNLQARQATSEKGCSPAAADQPASPAQPPPGGAAGEYRKAVPPENGPVGAGQSPILKAVRDLERLCSQQRAGLEKIKEDLAAPRRSPETAGREPGELYLLCRLGADCFGLPAGRVARVEKATAVSALPPEYAPIIGLAVFEGQAVPVISFSAAGGAGAGSAAEAARLVILRSGRSLAGLLVEGVAEVIPVAVSAPQPLPWHPAAGPRSYLTRITRHKDRFIFLLDVDKIMANLNSA